MSILNVIWDARVRPKIYVIKLKLTSQLSNCRQFDHSTY